jgi:phosphate transport system substrate-binding protein
VRAFEEETGIKFTSVENPGSGRGIEALIDGKVPLAGASRKLKARERDKNVKGIVIGYDAIAVFVHKRNPVENLTKEQLKGIFTGQIKNWKEVGGRNSGIIPNTEIIGEKRATIEVFKKLVMDNEPYGKGFKEIDLPRDQLVYLANEESGVCAVSIGLLAAISDDMRKKIKVISINGVEPSEPNVRKHAYLIYRPLILATNGAPQGNVREFISFMLSPKGQKFVAKNFIPIRTLR